MDYDPPSWMIHAQDVGLIGPASLRFHAAHAMGFTESATIHEALTQPTCQAIDLGSGGGLPGLVLAVAYPDSAWALLDARKRSQEHLEDAIASEGVHDRVSVAGGRAEELARQPELREQFTIATARGFAKPGVTAELASGFLAIDGHLVVSEPPEGNDRWPTDHLASLQLEPAQTWTSKEGHYRSFRKVAHLDERYPRRVGIPEKRPLF